MRNTRSSRREPAVSAPRTDISDLAGDLHLQQTGSIKDALLEVALQTFARLGFEGTSMGEVARQCGVSQPLVHYHYATKTALWQESVAKGMNEVYDQLGQSGDEYSDLDLVSEFRIFIRKYINFIFKRPHIFAIITKESDTSSERFGWIRESFLERFYNIWIYRIMKLREEGLLNSAAPEYHIAQVIVGACNHFLASRYRVLPIYGVDPDDQHLPRRHAEIVIDMVVNGLIAPASPDLRGPRRPGASKASRK